MSWFAYAHHDNTVILSEVEEEVVGNSWFDYAHHDKALTLNHGAPNDIERDTPLSDVTLSVVEGEVDGNVMVRLRSPLQHGHSERSRRGSRGKCHGSTTLTMTGG